MTALLAGVDLTTISAAAAPLLTIGVPIVLALVAGPKVFGIVIRVIKRLV
jgi:hypothetical protein